ncbi:TPA: GNAT family N-acetyltransferase [bacterium]|nr:GNAT family N-acetyltransferase [bacterium]
MEVYKRASELPEEWDEFCKDNYAMQRSFLTLMEEVNPCQQQYYLFKDQENKFDSVFMTFKKKKHNIGMFSPIDFKIDTTFIYVPLSIANAGIIIGEKTKEQVEKAIKKIRGCKLILNIHSNPHFKNFAFGLTCSNILLDIRWNSFEQYMSDLRSSYRYRYKKALKSSSELEFKILSDNKLFDDRLYKLYEDVFNNSKFQVEKLTKEFFQKCKAKIIVAYKGSEPIAFIQLIENKKVLVFGFIGVDYKYNTQYDLYITMLLKMVEYAIDHKFEIVDLGQTADDTKLKLGGRYVDLYALVHHSNPILNLIIRIFTHFIEFKPIKTKFNVFKSR